MNLSIPLGTKVICVDPPPKSNAATVCSGWWRRSVEKENHVLLKSNRYSKHLPRRKLMVNQENNPSSMPSMMLTDRAVTMNPDSSNTRRT